MSYLIKYHTNQIFFFARASSKLLLLVLLLATFATTEKSTDAVMLDFVATFTSSLSIIVSSLPVPNPLFKWGYLLKMQANKNYASVKLSFFFFVSVLHDGVALLFSSCPLTTLVDEQEKCTFIV